MPVTLQPVTKDNWLAIVQLKPPDDQKRFVASNLFSLAESRFNPSMVPLAIYAADVPVGFTMYGRDDDDGNIWIHRLMIDARYQRKGYGREAMTQLVEHLRTERDCPFVMIGWVPDNFAAENLYESLGFRKTGELVEGEIVARLDF
jgi:diamine N-acetyltransferase